MDSPKDLLEKYTAKGVRRGIKDPRYAGMTEALDRIFGSVLDALEETDQADNTLVIFTSDNGALISVADCRPLRMGKGYLYEAGIRVPTMIRWPARFRGGRVDATPIISTDLFPTILEAAGVGLPANYPGDGESLLPILEGRGSLKREALYFHYPNYAWHRSNRLSGAIRMGNYKLIERFDDGSVELYDLSEDPGETTDLSAVQTVRAARMKKRLAAWRKRVDAAMPVRADGK